MQLMRYSVKWSTQKEKQRFHYRFAGPREASFNYSRWLFFSLAVFACLKTLDEISWAVFVSAPQFIRFALNKKRTEIRKIIEKWLRVRSEKIVSAFSLDWARKNRFSIPKQFSSILLSRLFFYLKHLINIKPNNLCYCSNFAVSLLPNSTA